MKSDLLRCHVRLSVALLAFAPPSWAGVLIVDSALGPGADYFGIQQAVNAAQEGDTILVRDGEYVRFVITAKSLTIVADGDDAFVDGFSMYGPGSWSAAVQDLTAGQEVLIRGLRMNYGVSAADCDGSVWLDGITCTGGAGICAGGNAPGADVASSSKVTFTRCSFVGEVGYSFPFTPPFASPGMRVTASTVQVYDTQLTGGAGESAGTWPTPQPGAAGLKVDGSTVTLVGCSIAGGGGGIDPADPCSGPMAEGGPGVLFDGGPSTIRSAGSTAVGGVTSLEPLCPGQSGPAGPPIEGSGTIVPLVGFARHLQATGPVRGGESLTFDVEGLPNELPVLLVSSVHEPLPLLDYSGILLVGLPAEDVFVMAPLPASGQASLTFPIPNVGPLVGAVHYYVQALFLDPAQALWLGAGTTVVLLDAGT